jgi:hypothetical protein
MSQHLAFSLWAQADAVWLDLGRGWRIGSQDAPWLGAVAILAAMAIIGTAAWLVARHFTKRDQHPCNDPYKLFAELCRAHRLDRQQRRLLKRLTRAHALQQPALLFLEPERFEVSTLAAEWSSLPVTNQAT